MRRLAAGQIIGTITHAWRGGISDNARNTDCAHPIGGAQWQIEACILSKREAGYVPLWSADDRRRSHQFGSAIHFSPRWRAAVASTRPALIHAPSHVQPHVRHPDRAAPVRRAICSEAVPNGVRPGGPTPTGTPGRVVLTSHGVRST